MAETVVGIKLQAIDEISGKIDDIKKKFAGFSNIGDTLVNTGKQMAVMGGAMIAPFVLATKTFAEFEQSMKDVQVVSGATEEEFNLLTDAAKKIGETTKFSAKDAAEGLYSLASAGLKAGDQIKTLKNVTDLAAASNSEFASTASTIVSAVNQFGMSFDESARVADVFAGAISGSMATMEKLTASMTNAGAITSTLGMDIEDTTAYLMDFYDAGYQGEQAGTILKSALSKLLLPTTEAADALKTAGVNMDKMKNSSDPLRVALNALEKTGASTADIIKIFGQEAGPGVAALLKNGTAALDEYEAGLRSSAGAAEKMATDQMNTLEGMIKTIKSKLEGLMINLGKAILPIVKKIGEFVTKMIDTWNGLPEPLKDAIAQFTAVSAIVIVVSGGITALIGIIIKSITTWKTFGVAMTAVAEKFELLQTGIANVKLAFVDFKTSLATGLKLAGIVALLAAINTINDALKGMEAETISVVDNMNEKMGGIIDTSKNWYEVILEMTPLMGGLSAALHADRISGDLAEIVKITGENVDAFIPLVLKARDFGNVSFSGNIQELGEMAEETKNAGGMFQQFGTHVGTVKKALAETIIELEDQGLSVDALKEKWGGVITNFDAFIQTEKETKKLAVELTDQLELTGAAGTEAAESMMAGLQSIEFKSVSDKAGELVKNVAQIMGDGGTLSKEAMVAKLQEVDFTFLSTHAKDTALNILNEFKTAGASSYEALNAVNALGFDTLELTFSETAAAAVEYFELAGKDAARGMGVINDLSFSTLDEKVANLSKSFMETLTDAGINSKLAMEVINGVDFSGLKPTTEETKDTLIKLFEQAGYSSTEALEKVNEIDLEGLVKKSQETAGNIKDQYKSAADQTLAEFQKLNEYKFSQLQGEIDSFNTQKAQQEIAELKAAAAELDGTTITIYTRTVESE